MELTEKCAECEGQGHIEEVHVETKYIKAVRCDKCEGSGQSLTWLGKWLMDNREEILELFEKRGIVVKAQRLI